MDSGRGGLLIVPGKQGAPSREVPSQSRVVYSASGIGVSSSVNLTEA